MREIKFRAWDKKESEYINTIGLSIAELYLQSTSNQNTIIFQQYTGINDQNGVNVYEGDIVKGKKYGQFVIGVIQYELIHWFLNMNKNMHHLGSISHLEVIGNIYEHPELLESIP